MCFIVKDSILWTTTSFLTAFTLPLFLALFSDDLCFFQTVALCCMRKKSRTLFISGLREKKENHVLVCGHNIRITTPRLQSQDTACIAAKVMFDWWRQEMYIIGGGGGWGVCTVWSTRIKKTTSAGKTSILSFRKLDYIHHITRKKHTRRLHESKLINASGYKEENRSIINLKCCRESTFFIF